MYDTEQWIKYFPQLKQVFPYGKGEPLIVYTLVIMLPWLP